MFDCERWVRECLDSVFEQDYYNWQLVICVEPSTDRTLGIVHSVLKNYPEKKSILIQNKQRQHVPKNHIIGIRVCAPRNEDVVVCLDGDDRLFSSQTLSHLNSVYENPDVWITWGSYVFRHDLKKKGGASAPVTGEEFAGPRWWRYSHLKAFRYFLFKGIKDEDLKYTKTGEYYTVAGDMALMFPMVEMAGGPKHGRFIDIPLYVYNQSTPLNDEKLYSSLVKKCDSEIRSRPKYPEQIRETLCNLP